MENIGAAMAMAGNVVTERVSVRIIALRRIFSLASAYAAKDANTSATVVVTTAIITELRKARRNSGF
ncbi:hypothetical protein D3C73_1573180 [compost metagenome]